MTKITFESDTTAYSTGYLEARSRFREAAKKIGCQLEAHPIAAQDPQGSQLTIDVARFGDPDATRALILSSGLHGIEGFFGSAVQLTLLHRWSNSALRTHNILFIFIHAINPYGFATLRRCNENNVDLNRNFLLEGERYEGSPKEYCQLNALLNPQKPPSRFENLLFFVKAYREILRFGLPTVKQAIASGQYDFPAGLFYGGKRPTQSNEIIHANLRRWTEGTRHALHLDFHTGLGEWSTYRLFLDYPETRKKIGWLKTNLGNHVVERDDSPRIDYNARGSFGRSCRERLPNCHYTYLCAEFGTYANIRVLAGLRAENQAHHWGTSKVSAVESTKRNLQELFCPRSRRWRQHTLAQATELVDRAIVAIENPIDEV